MMDISMYGNHHPTHSSGFQNDLSATGYPHYYHHHLQSHQNVPTYAASTGASTTAAIPSPNPNPNNFYSSAAVAHPHLYSPTALEYGIHTSSANNSPSDQYYDGHSGNEGYFSTGVNNNSSGSPENHIISTDNGLSYTNLDYIAYQQAQAHAGQGFVDEKIHISHHYNEEMLMSGSQNALHHHHHHHHTNNPWHTPNNYTASNSGESGSLVTNQMQAISGNNLQNQQQQIQHNLHSPNSIQSTSPTLQSQQQQSENSCSQQQQQAVPTYKWMQVKRNVPKPQSEFLF